MQVVRIFTYLDVLQQVSPRLLTQQHLLGLDLKYCSE